MIVAVVFGHTFIILAGVLCVYFSVLLGINSIRNVINQRDEKEFKVLAFFSAVLAALAYFLSMFILAT